MSNWMDFSNEEVSAGSFTPIPKGTIVKAVLNINPGGSDYPEVGITGGWVKSSETSGAKYLDCEAAVLEGKYVKRKVFFKIGLFSTKGDTYGKMGRELIAGIIRSSRNVKGEADKEKMKINGIQDLNGMQFYPVIDMEQDQNNEPRNTIKKAVLPEKYGSDGVTEKTNVASFSGESAIPAKAPWKG